MTPQLTPKFRELTDQLPLPENIQFGAMEIDEFPSHRVAVSRSGRPTILLGLPYRNHPQTAYPIRLRNLAVLPIAHCRVSLWPGRVEEAPFAVIECLSDDPILQSYFLQLISPIITMLGPNPTYLDVSSAIDTVVKLFKSLSEKASRTVQGLWAELFIIAESKDPRRLAAAWHDDPQATFDFTEDGQYLEVKSTSGPDRVHRFSLEQIQFGLDHEVYVASIVVRRLQGGSSIANLLKKIEESIDSAEQILRIYQTIHSTIGEDLEDGLLHEYDLRLAKQSLTYYDLRSIPRPTLPLPTGVSQVRFNSDFSYASPLTPNSLRSKSGMLTAVP